MKKICIFLYLIFIFNLLLSIINCEENNNSEVINESNNTKVNNIDNTTEEENENDNGSGIDMGKGADAGFFITEQMFDEKLKNILEEKNLKPKKKITKQQLRHIFELIYKTDVKEDEDKDYKNEENDEEFNKEEHEKQYMDSIFNEVTKSLDYDDKISVRGIKDYINPSRVQAAYAELLQGLAESMGYL